jgi:hypothetical protein
MGQSTPLHSSTIRYEMGRIKDRTTPHKQPWDNVANDHIKWLIEQLEMMLDQFGPLMDDDAEPNV